MNHAIKCYRNGGMTNYYSHTNVAIYMCVCIYIHMYVIYSTKRCLCFALPIKPNAGEMNM